MNSDKVKTSDINLQTQSRKYDKPSTLFTPKQKIKASTKPLTTPNGLLQIPQPKVESIPKIPKGPLRCNITFYRVAHTYNIVDDLVQSPATMLTLEVLNLCPSQKKALLIALGIVYPSDDRLIVFLVDMSKHPPFPSLVSFKIPVRFHNAIIS